jgi:rfaE bifunctional protein kinase chain/domain
MKSFIPDPATLEKTRLLVTGDVMLDRYWFGDVNRISPEAPVPVVHVKKSEERAGGAANVALNIASLGCKTQLLAVVGADEPAQTLANILRKDNVEVSFLEDATLPTTVKLRVIGRQQQLMRLDFETPPSREILLDKLKDFEIMVNQADVVVLSDYGKGGLKHADKMISICKSAGKRVLVDPKGDDYSKYRGASLLTPNRSEFRQVVGTWKTEAELVEKAQNLRKELQLEALLVTRSEEGMTLVSENEIVHEPTQAQEVFDPTGAGDTVIAILGVMLAAGVDMRQAVHIANRAAGIVVDRLGTATVTHKELQEALLQE